MKMNIFKQGSHTIVSVEGKITIHTVDQLNDAIKRLIDAKVGSLVVDLMNVDLLDSNGIAMLYDGKKKMEEKKGRFHIANPSKIMQNTILLTGMDLPVIDISGEKISMRP